MRRPGFSSAPPHASIGISGLGSTSFENALSSGSDFSRVHVVQRVGLICDCLDVEAFAKGRMPSFVHNLEYRFTRWSVGTENILSQSASGREEIVGIHEPIDESPVVCRLCAVSYTHLTLPTKA